MILLDVGIKETIIAIITTNKNKIAGGSCPVFYAESEDEKNKTALLISKITMGMVHDLENGCVIIVRH